MGTKIMTTMSRRGMTVLCVGLIASIVMQSIEAIPENANDFPITKIAAFEDDASSLKTFETNAEEDFISRALLQKGKTKGKSGARRGLLQKNGKKRETAAQ